MAIEITSVASPGEIVTERVIMRASSEEDAGNYALFQGFASEGESVLTGDIPRTYWFPNKTVKKGDLLILYTKEGKQSEKKNKNGTTSHFFYWGLNQSLWTQGMVAVLVSTPTWQIFQLSEKK